MIRYVFFLLLLVFFTIMACDNVELPEPPPPPICDTLTYDVHLQPIIDKSCAFSGCHDEIQTAPGNFTNYTTLLPYLEDGFLVERVFIDQDMPLAPGSLNSSQRDSIECWLNTGFQEN